MARRIHANTLAIVNMLKAMDDGSTRDQLIEVSGLHHNTIYRWLFAMRKAKLVHIEGWERDWRGCNVVPVYKLGDGKDAKRIAPITDAEKAKRYRHRKKLQAIGNALTGVANV